MLPIIYPSVVSGEIRIGSIGKSAFNWHLYVMLNKGFLNREEVRAKIINFREKQRALSALADGSIQVLGVTKTDEVIESQIKGENIIIVGGIMHKIPYSLVLSRKERFVRNLKGRYIGVYNYKGDLTVLLKQRLERYGLLYPMDYKMIEIPHAKFYHALRYGEISAGLIYTPMAHRINQVIVEDLASIYPQYQYTVAAMNSYWAQRNNREAIAVMKGIIQSINWLLQIEHRREAIDIFKEHVINRDEPAILTYDCFFRQNQIFTENADLNRNAMYEVIHTMIEGGILERREFAISRFLNENYRNMAIRQLR